MVKYGVVGALALAVLVAAMWDGSKKPSPETTGPAVEGTLGQAKPKQEATLTPQPVAAKPEAKPIEEEFVQHTVQAKETLRTIAKTWLKDESRWQELLEANKSRITDPHHLAKGLTLVFPKSKLEKKGEDEGGAS